MQINLTKYTNCFNRIGRNLKESKRQTESMRNISLTIIITTTTVTTGNGAG
ncbi:thr operon leader peptide [Providencia rettgeri]|nr:thr operon leader peptide [Providencia rettgeri]QIF60587.1 thr operon leader peptide [Providencia sp. 1701091]EHZ7765716.1 thr operon leader peptide [Providencia rettgeri]EIJ7168858.1 thr operon leader peptide [Providencia rettgeri]EJD6047722.1 thr operon leader peptide [Providencia rettgeri]